MGTACAKAVRLETAAQSGGSTLCRYCRTRPVSPATSRDWASVLWVAGCQGSGRGGHGQNPLRMSALEGCWRGSILALALPILGTSCVFFACPGVTAGPGDSQRTWPPAPCLSPGGALAALCTLVSVPPALGVGGLSTALCLQLIRREKVLDASIQELLEPLNLDFKSPLEKVGAQVGLPGLPTGVARRPLGGCDCTDHPPVPKCQARPGKCWKENGEALLIPWQLQDTQTQPVGQATTFFDVQICENKASQP